MRYLLDVDERVRIPDKDINAFWRLPVYVSFVGDFNEESTAKFRENMEAAEDAAKKSGQECIPIVIDSYGGSVYALLGMVDTIKNCTLPVATIVEGKAMSCGAFLFSCGTEGYRYIGPHATVMIHTVTIGEHGKLDEFIKTAEEAKRLNDLVFEMMSENCGHHKSYFYDVLKEEHTLADWHLDAQECKKHNLANHIKIPTMETKVVFKSKFG